MIRSFIAALALLAETGNPPTDQATPAPTSAPPALKEISPGILEFNGIRLDKKARCISFPATVNQHQGLVEYLLVHEHGKTHESLFATRIAPHDIHLALLLIGLQEDAKANAKETPPPTTIDPAYLKSAPKLKGSPVLLSVSWTAEGKRREIAAEDWIFNLQTSRPMKRGPWTYNGSLIENGIFLADQELSIAAVITDPTALVNNPREGYDNDEIWQIRKDAVPPIDTPVEFSITLAKPSTKP